MNNKIFSASQIKQWDAATIYEQNISSVELMERAAHVCLQWIKNHFSIQKSFYIFCGNGNNGGDGLVLTRLLIEAAYDAKAVLINTEKTFSEDAQINLNLLKEYAPRNIVKWKDNFLMNDISQDDIIIDAIFGTGLNRNVEGKMARQIQLINQLPNTKIAIDISSGLFTDILPNVDAAIIEADYTLSFQIYNRSFLHAESAKYVGDVQILNIDLSKSFEKDCETNFHIIDHNFIHALYRKRSPFSHKGTYGTAILVGGSYGKIGAIALSAKAALRAGAGKIFVQAPECGYEILQTYIPEAMFENAGKDFIEKILPDDNCVIGLGPGFGTNTISAKAIHTLLKNHHRPLIIDADALNIIAADKQILLPLIPKNSIITPHPKEFERLFGSTYSSMQQTDLAIQKAKEYKIVIVLKGHRTAVCTSDGNCFYNLSGNAGMATAGSGDVLTGIITSLLAQGYSSEHAAILGVYLHGLSGDIVAQENSQEALIAGDLIDNLGRAFLSIQHSIDRVEHL